MNLVNLKQKWEPELKAMRKNANRWHMNQEQRKHQGSDIHLYNGEININGKKENDPPLGRAIAIRRVQRTLRSCPQQQVLHL